MGFSKTRKSKFHISEDEKGEEFVRKKSYQVDRNVN